MTTDLPVLREAVARMLACGCPGAYRGMLCRACVADARSLLLALPALLDEVERLRQKVAEYESHGPDGHNVTNLQFQTVRHELEAARAVLGGAEQLGGHGSEPRIDIQVDRAAWLAWRERQL